MHLVKTIQSNAIHFIIQRWKFLLMPLSIGTLAVLIGCPGGGGPPPPPPPPLATLFVPNNPQGGCPVTPVEFATWFHTGAVTLNGVVDPANSLTPLAPNCDFYKWSERMFLWLTSPAPSVYGGGKFIFDSPTFYDVSAPDGSGNRTFIPHTVGKLRSLQLRAAQVGFHGLPAILDRKGKVIEVEQPRFSAAGKQLIMNARGDSVEIERAAVNEKRELQLFDKAGKIIQRPRALLRPQLRLTAMKDEQKFTIVQKIMVDKIPFFLDQFGNVADVEQGMAGGNGVLEAQNGSLVYYATMVNDVYAYFRTSLGASVPAGTMFPTTNADLASIVAFGAAHSKTFPDANALAIEVKTSWVEASTLPNPNDFITMQAEIPDYDKSNPDTWPQKAPPNDKKKVTLAMVGMHVVGSTIAHPEMIWATFEHQSNTPNATYTYTKTGGTPQTVNQTTTGNWLFCASGSGGPFNDQHMHFDGTSSIEHDAPFHITPSDTRRDMPWGMAGGAASSNTEIIASNNSVRGMLMAGDVRKNYIMHGATWFIPSTTTAVGTNQLANTTMETYTQGNCFDCHGTRTTVVSHMFNHMVPLF